MSGRVSALAICALSFAAVAAQYAWPRWPGFHEWQYATLLFVAALLIANVIWGIVRAPAQREGAGVAIASLGAMVAVVAGLCSGLLGPDTQRFARGPGSVVPLLDAGVAVGFPVADAGAIARGDSVLDLRKRDHTVEPLAAGSRTFAGAFVFEAESKPAAFIRATDLGGRHMTITQPTGAAFLSPVLLFPTRVTIGANTLDSDSFAVPALQKLIKAIYFPAKTLALSRGHGEIAGQDALLFVVDDTNGQLAPGGIGLTNSGRPIRLGGVILAPTLGTYPELVVSAIPVPAAVLAGFVIFLIGAALSLTRAVQATGEPVRAEKVLRPG